MTIITTFVHLDCISNEILDLSVKDDMPMPNAGENGISFQSRSDMESLEI